MISRLPIEKQPVISEMIGVLSDVKEITAIALGGSYALGNATKNSDIDLAIYYSEKFPPNIEEIRSIAKQFDSSDPLVITNFYEWGPWVNGGAWLYTKIGEVDWLYRNLDQVNRVIEEAKKGKFAWDYRQQPPYGYFSVMYLADLQSNISLYDPQGILSQLKEETKIYPESLRNAIIQEHLWSIEFSYFNAVKLAERNSIYGTVGCITRIVAELTQVLFGLNRVYFSSEKNALKTIETFSIKPPKYSHRVNAILSRAGEGITLIESLKNLKELIQEVIKFSESIYSRKYLMD